jgi:D-arabinose 1-dehydrogenase-like Zn-dependent alcohol dehydrogenase
MVRKQNSRDSTPDSNYHLGSLKPVVDSVYEFEDALKAYDRLLSHRATGKVVVKIDPIVN